MAGGAGREWGGATSVSPKAQSPNACDERRGERRHGSDERRADKDREMEAAGDGLTECETWRGEQGEKWMCEEDGTGKWRRAVGFHQYSATCL